MRSVPTSRPVRAARTGPRTEPRTEPRDPPAPPSGLADALVRIGDRWSLLLVDALAASPLRFADLQARVPGISTNILAARLRHLEAEGVVMAVPYSERPRRFTYELTRSGQDLGGTVRMLSQWSADHMGRSPGRPTAGPTEPGAPTHPACGTPMVAAWWCPTCEQPGGNDGTDPVWV
jgi:DNA-binding HxlR family transcriptional regulator